MTQIGLLRADVHPTHFLFILNRVVDATFFADLVINFNLMCGSVTRAGSI